MAGPTAAAAVHIAGPLTGKLPIKARTRRLAEGWYARRIRYRRLQMTFATEVQQAFEGEGQKFGPPVSSQEIGLAEQERSQTAASASRSLYRL